MAMFKNGWQTTSEQKVEPAIPPVLISPELEDKPVAKKEALDKFLEQQEKLAAQKMELIKDILEQKKAAMKEFDDQLAQLGYYAKAVKTAPTGRICSICGETGHNARTCPKKKGKKE